MGRGSDGIGPRDQEPPVVSSVGCGDVVVYVLHLNGGIGNPCTVPYVRDCAFHTTVDLQTHTSQYSKDM